MVLLCILAVASVLRLSNLSSVPVGFSDDEVRATMTAFSVWHTGKDLYRDILLPFSFIIDSFTFSPIPIYLQAPFVGLMGLSVFSARLPFALFGILTVLGVYLLARKISGKASIALLSAFVISISVWHIQISRMAYEGGIALGLYVFATWLFLEAFERKGSAYLISAMVLFFAAFNSYNATKVIFLPVLVTLSVYGWHRLRVAGNKLFVVLIGIILTFTLFGYFAKTQQAGTHGSSPFFFGDLRAPSEAVELERRASSAPWFLRTVYHNKATVLFKIFLDRYMFAFSPQFLLLTQEGSGIYSLWGRGNLYVFEGILVILGLMALYASRRREAFLVVTLMLVAPLPSGIGADPQTYLTRSSYLLPWLVLCIAFGIDAVIGIFRAMPLRIFAVGVIVVAYVYSLGGYLSQYYFEWPRYGAKYYSQGTIDMLQYVARNKGRYTTVTVGNINGNALLHYAFRSGAPLLDLKRALAKSPLVLDNVRYATDCIYDPKGNPRVEMPKRSLHITRDICHKDIEPDDRIMSPDGLLEWKIFKSE